MQMNLSLTAAVSLLPGQGAASSLDELQVPRCLVGAVHVNRELAHAVQVHDRNIMLP